MNLRIRNKKGFTLVEVIVVAVIVAALSLTAILLYMGYVREARQDTVENVASSAATILNSAVNMGVTVDTLKSPLNEYEKWNVTLPTGQAVLFTCPKETIIELDIEKKEVHAILKGVSSSRYKYDN